MAWAAYGDGEEGVVLALRRLRPPDGTLAAAIGKVFADLCSTNEHLDIVFLSAEHERRMSSVCRPFWPEGERPGSAGS